MPVKDGDGTYIHEQLPADKWLARNATLLSSLSYWEEYALHAPSKPETLVSEGLTAAAAAVAVAQCRQSARLARALGCRPAYAAGLPLQSLQCDVPCTAILVSTLAAVAPKLTCLSLGLLGRQP